MNHRAAAPSHNLAMSIRGMWAILKSGELLYSRRFPTVERRARREQGKAYKPLGRDAKFLPLLKRSVLSEERAEPIVQCGDKERWTFVSVRSTQVVLLALPLRSSAGLGNACVPQVLSVLQEILPHITWCATRQRSRLPEFDRIISAAMPFGRFIGIRLHDIRDLATSDERPSAKGGRRAVWQAVPRPIRSIKVGLELCEVVDASLFGPPGTARNVVRVSGRVECEALVPAGLKVRVHVASPAIVDMRLHTCVEELAGGALVFVPPREKFALCSYAVRNATARQLCVTGRYRVIEAGSDGFMGKIHVEISDVKNIKSLSVRIPLPQPLFKSFRVLSQDSDSALTPPTKRQRFAIWKPLAHTEELNLPYGAGTTRTSLLRFEVKYSEAAVLGSGERPRLKDGDAGGNGPLKRWVDNPTEEEQNLINDLNVEMSKRNRPTSNVTVDFLHVSSITKLRLPAPVVETGESIEYRVAESTQARSVALIDPKYYNGDAWRGRLCDESKRMTSDRGTGGGVSITGASVKPVGESPALSGEERDAKAVELVRARALGSEVKGTATKDSTS